MILLKIAQKFILPSIFIPVLILAGLFFRKRKTAKTLIAIALLFYYLFSIAPTADLILKPLEEKYPSLLKEDLFRADKIVLELGGKEADVLRASEILWIYNQRAENGSQNLKIVISGTNPLKPGENEGAGIKRYLVERGIAEEVIVLESNSRNTAESARRIKEMLTEEPFFLVTSAYHMPRSMEIFQKVGTNPIPAPTDFKIKKDYDVLSFFPNSNNIEKSDLAFHEYFGILFYRLIY